jgi:NAD(P)H-dependent FMN reductase
MTMEEQPRLAVIVGSTREGRLGHRIANWFAGQAGQHGEFEVDLIDLAEARLPATITAYGAPPPAPVTALAPRLANADAFVVVTPEYNHSFPASVKSAIDWYFEPWQAKPVGFVSYGGLAGGVRAVEHLRAVFAEVHAMTVRATVSIHSCWDRFDESGGLRDDESGNAAAKRLLDQLTWWSRALREARARNPYTP